MAIKEALIAALLHEPKRTIIGRTLLQKRMYFIALLMDEDFGFEAHFYGPYSSRVSQELGEMVEAGLVSEVVNYLPSGDPRFGQRKRYSYSLSVTSDLATLFKGTSSITRYSDALDRIDRMSISHDSELLSVAAKVSLILSQQGTATSRMISEQAQELGWQVDEDQIEAVARALAEINLVTETDQALSD